MDSLISTARGGEAPLSPLEGFMLVVVFITIQLFSAALFILPLRDIFLIDELLRNVLGALLFKCPGSVESPYLKLGSLASSTLVYLSVLPVVYAYLRVRGIRLASYVGLSRTHAARALLSLLPAGVACAVALYTVSFVQAMIYALCWVFETISSFLSLFGDWRSLRIVARVFDVKPQLQPVVTMMQKETSVGMIVWMVVLATVMASVVEEILFRGLFYRPLRSRIGVFPAVLLSAFLFAGVHGSIHAFAHLFVFAIILAILYERTQNMLAPILLHLLHNGVMAAVILLVAGKLN